MKILNKIIGIWGYGIVGQAATQFLLSHGAQIIVYDNNSVSVPSNVRVAVSLDQLFAESEAILPSPGIDIRNYKNQYQGEWIAELDLFQQFFHKPIIAIAGSVGKTTVTHLLAHMLKQAGWRVEAAGNIGVPALSMIEKQNQLDAIVLEVSSFQLEHTQSFAPDLAIWTNLYPNHLDRHTTMQAYFYAKYQLIKYQTEQQHALIPLTLQKEILAQYPKSSLICFSDHDVLSSKEEPPQDILPINWHIVCTALKLLNVKPQPLQQHTPLSHRIEKVAMVNGITFYNDSKSTTPNSTLAAVQRMQAARTILFLGGLGKGIDRTGLIKALATHAIFVICFGAEAQILKTYCDTYALDSISCTTLEQAFDFCMTIAQPNDCVLFSPAGTSFDLFKNYQERGNCFKQLVHALF